MGCRRDMWVRHLSPLYLSGLGLARPDLVPQHVLALVSRGYNPALREPALAHGEHERRVSEVGRAAVAVEVGDEFLGKYSHELRVEARLGGEVGVVRQRSSDRGPTAALGARFVSTGSRARGGHASLAAVARWDRH